MSKEAETSEQLVAAYDRLLELIGKTLEQTRSATAPALHQIIEDAKTKALELRQLSQEEADKVAKYVHRDLHDAAEFIAQRKNELSDWLRLDTLLVEKETLHKLTDIVTRTRLDLSHLARNASHLGDWHTGEIRGIGTLQCSHCGKQLHFHKTARIPPCPQCHGTVFKHAPN